MNGNPRPWRGAMKWGRAARWKPTPRELRAILVVAVLVVLGLIGQLVLH
jgi:hypothetical protein